MLELNADVVHVYGLTETYGPTTVCEIQPNWLEEPVEQRAVLMSRQGVPYLLAQDIQVLDDADLAFTRVGQGRRSRFSTLSSTLTQNWPRPIVATA